MQSKTTSCHVTPVKTTIVRMTTNYCWQGCGERGPSHTVGGNINRCSQYTAWMSQNTKHGTIIWPSNFTPGCILKNNNTNLKRYKTLMTLMFIATLFIISNIWKQPKCSSTDEWTEKMYTYMHKYTHTHTMKYCSVCMKVTLLYPTLCYPMDYSPPGSSDHGNLQARILEWAAIPFSRRSFWCRDQTWVSRTAGRFFTFWANGILLSYKKEFVIIWMDLEGIILLNKSDKER